MNLPFPQTTTSLKILLADDNETDRLILASLIKKLGHEVVVANDGQEAVELFEQQRPQVVLLDALMPRMNGMEAAALIKELAGDDFVPVLFLTSLKDAHSLADCLEAGGDDFLSKPYNRIIFQAKLNALIRMRNMHVTMQSQRDQLSQHHDHLMREQGIAKAVFDNVAHSGCLDAPNIKRVLSPLALFNGDVVLAAQKPSGGMHVLLGDFTGHGLAAAIGAMPMAEIFYGMSGKGFTISDIVSEINLKLKSVLPVGVFCCTCMIDLSFEKQILKIWLGGLPDCFLYHDSDGSIERISSQHLPLGILEPADFNSDLQIFEMRRGDRLLACSDGIPEALNNEGEMFGEERIVAAMEACEFGDDIFENVNASVANFVGNSVVDDDATLIEVKMVADFELKNFHVDFIRAGLTGPLDWKMEYELGALTLRDFNPLPLMLHILMEVPGLRAYSGQVYTILAELYSNSLEHGVLGLDSKLKATAAGFIEYYEKRGQLLQNLEAGHVKFKFKHVPTKNGGSLQITIEDSGDGFDFTATEQQRASNGDYCGRGVSLINSLCDSVDYRGNGNIVDVSYLWFYD